MSLLGRPGKVHGLLGENGAGKSTLAKILIEDKPTKNETPADATRAGIGMLHQDPLDVPTLTILENLMAGASAWAQAGFLDTRQPAALFVIHSQRGSGREYPPTALTEMTCHDGHQELAQSEVRAHSNLLDHSLRQGRNGVDATASGVFSVSDKRQNQPRHRFFPQGVSALSAKTK